MLSPTSHSSFFWSLRHGWLAFRRERNMALIIAMLASAMVFLQILLLLLFSVFDAQGILASRSAVRIEMLPEASQQRVQELYAALSDLAVVDSITYVTQEQAYARAAIDDPELILFLEDAGLSNPFPDMLSIRLTDISAYSTLAAFLRQPLWQSTVDPAYLSQLNTQRSELLNLRDTLFGARVFLSVLLLASLASIILVLMYLVRTRFSGGVEAQLTQALLGAEHHDVFLPVFVQITLVLLLSTMYSLLFILTSAFAIPFLFPTVDLREFFLPVRFDLLSQLLKISPLILVLEIGGILLLAGCSTFLGMPRRKLWQPPVQMPQNPPTAPSFA